MTSRPDEPRKNASTQELPCCALESVVSVDERGQMVLPKEIREAAGLKPGDKLAVIMWRGARGSCCLTLIKADELKDLIREKLGPMIKDLIQTT
ncbi:MAG: AbrB/MazE/SpoVT family DNA-binding domain-containing protein [Candidatus Aminicenantes bacterium]|nr:AbrB/MazE/SpoVT family DNA-binding domain-containing protein [Candidatus Aminicenantes bacterium]